MSKKPIFISISIFLLALLLRLPNLGSYLTIDEIKWIEGAGQFLLALRNGNFFQTYWHFFPGITITWGEAVILWMQYLSGGSGDLSAFVSAQVADLAQMIGPMRLSGVIITSLSVAGVYGLARPLTGDLAAGLGAALLAADPFFTAHSRIVNGDAAAAILMFLAILAFARLWQTPSLKWSALAGVMAGLALLTKLPSPLIFPWIGVMALIGFAQNRNRRFWLKALLLFGVAAALTFVILFPAMWVKPLETLRLMYADSFNVGGVGAGHDTFFLGKISHNPGWGFYPLVIAYRLTPIIIFGLAAGLLWLWLGRPNRQAHPQSLKLLLSLLVYTIFIYLFASVSPKKLDRYLMPVIPALILIAGVGWAWLIRLIARRTTVKKQLSPALAAALIVAQAFFVVSNYPYVLTYYNPLLGGYARAVTQVPVGWGEGIEQAAQWINAQPNASDLRVSSWYGDMARPYLQTQSNSFSSSGKGQLSADYVIFYINQMQRHKPYPALINYFTRQKPAFQLDYRGTPYVWVYNAPRMQTEVSGKTKIEGRAAMLGYSWTPHLPHKANDAAELRLFLRPLGNLPPNETFDVALASPDGALWGDWTPAEQNEWSADQIIEWRGALTLPAQISTGNYRLVVRLMDTNINGEVTRFPLEDSLVIYGD